MFHQLPKQEVPKEVKKESIRFILKEAKLAPQTFSQFVLQFYKDFGLRFIFQGIEDVLLLVFILLIPATIIFRSGELVIDCFPPISYFIAMMVSPVTFGLLYFLSIWKEILVGTFELKQTLRVSLRELMTMRILVFSVIALVVSVIQNIILWLLLKQSISLIDLLSVSFASLFIFTSGQLVLEVKLSMKGFFYVGPIIWFALSSVLCFFYKEVGTFLMKLPLIVTIALIAGGVIVYLNLMKKSYAQKKEGGLVYART